MGQRLGLHLTTERDRTRAARRFPPDARSVRGMTLLVIVLIVLAIASGVLGAIVHGLFWLFILTVVFLAAAYFVGRSGSRSRT